MKVIWKAKLEGGGSSTIRLPKGAKILWVATQDGKPMIWALVDPDAEVIDIPVGVYATGENLPDDVGRFIGAFYLYGGTLVYHVFQKEQIE